VRPPHVSTFYSAGTRLRRDHGPNATHLTPITVETAGLSDTGLCWVVTVMGVVLTPQPPPR
jgi:hypothetical protein